MTGLWSTLAGVRVVELGQNIAGPYAASVLSSFGAETIKIEPPGGDVTRTVRPAAGVDGEDVSAFFAGVNVDKRYVCVDEKHPEGRRVIERLVGSADVFIQNSRPGRLEALGLGADVLHARNRRLIHCSVVAFYPDSDGRPGYDLLVQAESGLMSITGEADRGPARLPVPIIDYVAGLWTAMGAAVALQGARDRVVLRTSMLDVALALMSDGVSMLLAGGPPRRRTGSGADLAVPYGAYPTADGTVVLAAASDHLFARAVAVLGDPLLSEERFAELRGRMEHRNTLEAAISAAMRTRSSGEWCQAFDSAGVPAGMIREIPDAVARHVSNSSTGVRPIAATGVVAPPVESVGERWDLRSSPGSRGRDTRQVLAAVGFGDDEVEHLVVAGAVQEAGRGR